MSILIEGIHMQQSFSSRISNNTFVRNTIKVVQTTVALSSVAAVSCVKVCAGSFGTGAFHDTTDHIALRARRDAYINMPSVIAIEAGYFTLILLVLLLSGVLFIPAVLVTFSGFIMAVFAALGVILVGSVIVSVLEVLLDHVKA